MDAKLTLHYLDMMTVANERQLRLDMESAEEYTQNNSLIYDSISKLENLYHLTEILDERDSV